MDKLQHIEEMKKQLAEMKRQLAALKAEVAQETKSKQWEPEGGEFLCHHTGFIVDSNEDDFASAVNGCVYKTEEQAEKAAKAMRTHNRLLAYVAEFAPDWEPDWGDVGKSKFCIMKDNRGEFFEFVTSVHCISGAVFMPKDVAIELCRKLNSGEVVL